MAKGKRASRSGVDPAAILEAAFALYADEGEAGFSVRKVGSLTGVDPMTVLHHFGSKRGLLRRIADRALTEVELPASSSDWRADLLAVAQAYRSLAHRFPKVFHLHFQFHATGPNDHAAAEIVYRAMRTAGLSDRMAAEQGLAYYAFVLGFALAETEGLMSPILSQDETELLALDAVDYVATRALVPAFKALEPDAAFTSAVTAYVAGLAQLK